MGPLSLFKDIICSEGFVPYWASSKIMNETLWIQYSLLLITPNAFMSELCVFFFWDVEIHHKSKYLKNSSRLISTMIFKSVVKFRVFHEKIWVWCLPLCWDTDTFLYTFRMYHYWCSIISRLNRIQKHYCTSVIEYSVIVETPWIFERRNVEWKIWDIDLNSYDKDHKPQF